jgi:hypothetical protein
MRVSLQLVGCPDIFCYTSCRSVDRPGISRL